MKLQIGFDDFGQVKNNNYNFIDKTLFIKDFLDDCTQVSVITRPRRFGKTFNLSMLHYFLAAEVYSSKTQGLFDDLNIAKIDNGTYMQHQGRYPVVTITFKGIKEESFANTLLKFKFLIQEMYRAHYYLVDSKQLNEYEKKSFLKYLTDDFNQAEAENALYLLTELVSKHYQQKVWLLIDEYDTPIQAGYLNNHYQDIVKLMRDVFGAALKNNRYLERAVVTGILRIAKESLFSGINNLTVYSVLQTKYSQYFGFTEAEVSDILQQTNLTSQEQEIKKWYNGYIFGHTTVYNPWSIVNCIYEDGVLKPYWGNTSDNALIKTLVIKSAPEFKHQIALLLQDRVITKNIDDNMVFGDLHGDPQAAWSLLLMNGYLKVVKATVIEGVTECELAIPNFEIKILYRMMVKSWLGNGNGAEWYQNFLTHLLNGDIESFKQDFGQVLTRTISVHDAAHNPEAFYHGFILGLTAGLDQAKYEIRSNKESGLGRYDIAIIPKDLSRLAIIFEIKSLTPPKLTKKKLAKYLELELTKAAQIALEQINGKQYETELSQRGINNILKIGLAFSGKNFYLAV